MNPGRELIQLAERRGVLYNCYFDGVNHLLKQRCGRRSGPRKRQFTREPNIAVMADGHPPDIGDLSPAQTSCSVITGAARIEARQIISGAHRDPEEIAKYRSAEAHGCEQNRSARVSAVGADCRHLGASLS